jgi:hypothetical protein
MNANRNLNLAMLDSIPSAVRRMVLLLCLVWMPGALKGSIWIDLPETTILADTAGQIFEVWVQNDGSASIEVTGIGFNVQVSDGGPPAGGSITGPAITSVDIFTGTAFASNNNGPSGTGSIVPQVYERGTLTDSGTVTLPTGLSKMATVVMDTTGFKTGTFSLTLDTRNGPAKFTTMAGDLYPGLIDGSVTLVPEPVSGICCIGAILLVYAGMRGNRRRR